MVVDLLGLIRHEFEGTGATWFEKLDVVLFYLMMKSTTMYSESTIGETYSFS